MAEILTAFGVDWRLLVIQIFNFTLLLALLWYFLYQPVLRVLSERQEKIKKGVEDADRATQRLADADEEKKGILEKANEEASNVVTRSKEHAQEQTAKMVGDAEVRGERILEDAARRAEEIKQMAQKESEAEVAKAAVLAAEKILRKES